MAQVAGCLPAVGPADQPFLLRTPFKAGSLLWGPAYALGQCSWTCPTFFLTMEGKTQERVPDCWALDFSLVQGCRLFTGVSLGSSGTHVLYRGLRATSRSSGPVTMMSSMERTDVLSYGMVQTPLGCDVTGRRGANVALGQSRPCVLSSTAGGGECFCPSLPIGVQRSLFARPAATWDPLEVTFTCSSHGLLLGCVCSSSLSSSRSVLFSSGPNC